MSKKNRQQTASLPVASSHAAEYRIIKFDLIKVAILNAIYLLVLLTLYYTNMQSHYLDAWFAKILHF